MTKTGESVCRSISTRAGNCQVGLQHHPDELLETHLRLPAQFRRARRASARKSWISPVRRNCGLISTHSSTVEEHCWTARVHAIAAMISWRKSETLCEDPGADDVVLGFCLLQHGVHGLNVVSRKSPVAPRLRGSPVASLVRLPSSQRAAAREILRVTISGPRRGDS